MDDDANPIVLITGAAGNIGTALAAVFEDDSRVVGWTARARRRTFR